MTTKQIALLIGGVIPAVLMGLSSVLQKACTGRGSGTGPFLIGTGATTVLVGIAFVVLERDANFTRASVFYTVLFGLFWATAVGCVATALRHYGAQISQLVPLYNMNTLVAVLIGLFVFSEWHSINGWRVAGAAVLIILGGMLAAKG